MSARDDDPTIAGLRLAEKQLRAEELHYPADSVASAITRLESQNRDNARVSRSRDDLAELLADDWNPDQDPILTAMFRDYAQTILAAGWRPPARKITTAAELRQMEISSVVQDQWGGRWTKGDFGWHQVRTDVFYYESDFLAFLPLTVLSDPEPGDDDE